MHILILGMGNMGRNLALNLQDHGHTVVGWNRSAPNRDLAQQAGLKTVFASLAEAVAALPADQPRITLSLVAAGSAVDEVLFDAPENLYNLLQADDIVIDAANSHYLHSQKRAARFADKRINWLDCGISGGVEGARNGACLMLGGDKVAFDNCEALLTDACVEHGIGYFGPAGAGHFVKMLHNAIEYGMMQSIAEGLNLIQHSDFSQIDLAQLTQVWNHGSIIQGKLLGFIQVALQSDATLADTAAEVGNLGTGKWAAELAEQLQLPFGAIQAAVNTRDQAKAKSANENFLFRVLQAMRAQFGKHSADDRPA